MISIQSSSSIQTLIFLFVTFESSGEQFFDSGTGVQTSIFNNPINLNNPTPKLIATSFCESIVGPVF